MNEPAGEDPFDDFVSDYLAGYLVQLESGVDTSRARRDSALPPEVEERLRVGTACLETLAALDNTGGWDLNFGRGGSSTAVPGKIIGRFQILETLGAGGFGLVYRAWDPDTERFVALKIPRFEALLSSDLRRRFELEARAAAKLDHPNVVAVLEAGIDGMVPYIASMYHPGLTLADWLKEERRAEARQAAQTVKCLAVAMAHAHAQGVLHRDIKPSNILLVPNREASKPAGGLLHYTAKLMDFGLAKLTGATGDMTQTGTRLGTLQYMPPEQAGGRNHEIGPASDVYGLGAVLYELLSGSPPFAAESELEIIRQVQQDEPARLRTAERRIPRDLETICLKCLEKQPARRYESTAQLAEDLGRFLDGVPVKARPTGQFDRAIKWTRRYPARAALIAVSTLAVMGIIVGQAISNRLVRTERDRATQSEQLALAQSTIARNYAYCADMRLAQDAWDRSSPAETRRILDRYLPKTGEPDLRGLEWRLIERQLDHYGQVVARQPLPILALAVSPDQQLFATGDDLGVVRIWSFEKRELLREMHCRKPAPINALVFSRDQRHIIAASDDSGVYAWRVDDGHLETLFQAHESWVGGLAVSPSDELLATGDSQGRVLLWDFATGQLKAELFGQRGAVRALVFHPSEPWLVAVLQEEIRAWDYFALTPLADLPDGMLPKSTESQWRCGAFTPEGCAFYAPGPERIYAWRFDREHLGQFHGTVSAREADSAIAITPDHNWILSGGLARHPDITGRIVNREEIDFVARGHSGRIRSIVALADDHQFLSAADDATVRHWNMNQRHPHYVRQYVGDRLRCLAWSPDGRRLAIGLHHGEVTSVDRDSPWDRTTHYYHVDGVRGLAYSSDGSKLISIDNEGAIKSDQDGRFKVLSHRGLPEGNHFVVAADDRVYCQSQDKILVGLEADSGRELWRREFSQGVNALVPSGDALIVALQRGLVVRLIALTGEEVACFSPSVLTPIESVHLAADGRRLAAVNDNMTLFFLDITTLAEQQRIGILPGAQRLFLIDDDRRVLVNHDTRLSLLDSETGQTLLSLENPMAPHAMALSPDRKVLAASSGNDLILFELH